MVKIEAVTLKDKGLLYNINQKYLYEMTNFYPDQMDENGNLGYGYFDEYFTDPNRKAFFIYDNQALIGFAMLNPYSVSGCRVDYTMAEFTIFPSYRKRGLASCAAGLLFDTFKGVWEVKFNQKNLPAKGLWQSVTKQYNPQVIYLNEQEIVLLFTT